MPSDVEPGMVMVQSPLATGLVDYELPPAEMASQLMAYVAHAFGRPPPGRRGQAAR
jgi:hypothetical protein